MKNPLKKFNLRNNININTKLVINPYHNLNNQINKKVCHCLGQYFLLLNLQKNCTLIIKINNIFMYKIKEKIIPHLQKIHLILFNNCLYY